MTDQMKVILKGKAAVTLWQQGRDAWNRWVGEHPEADISFESTDLSSYQHINFTGYHFPNGLISFKKTIFGDGETNFDRAKFGHCQVDFTGAMFGLGKLSFLSSEFEAGQFNFNNVHCGDTEIVFDMAAFGHINADFSQTEFGKGNLSFRHVTFSDGDINFSNSRFAGGNVSFSDSVFNTGDINFSGTHFGKGNTLFKGTRFIGGNVHFIDASFEGPLVSFSETHFGDTDVNFSDASFGDRNVNFEHVFFKCGDVDFSGAHFHCNDVSFFAARFEICRVNFTSAKFRCETCEFNKMYLDQSPIRFNSILIGAEIFEFEDSIMNHFVDLRDIIIDENVQKLSFRHTAFRDSLSFSISGSSSMIPDFTESLLPTQVCVPMLNVDLLIQRKGIFTKALRPNDSEKLRILRRLVEKSGNTRLSKKLWKLQRRAQRWHTLTRLESVLDILVSFISGYGQYVCRPLFIILVLILLHTVFSVSDFSPQSLNQKDLVASAKELLLLTQHDWLASLSFAIHELFPYLPNIGSLNNQDSITSHSLTTVLTPLPTSVRIICQFFCIVCAVSALIGIRNGFKD
ncbi:pentapeptide repeat-containing protein [Veronia pacifica]|uniref:Pentapeptide repeat-containing protein n=1 Tax=Veronia pacifica TaxID=1080227 RepID=A0A1C3ESP7_9GAMM|nr:hypothetical protein [Veronia pacifica]ODA36229.1 hypothetical protein A8L45_01090 [Veronia pacifica]